MNIKTYDDIQVLVNWSTPFPGSMVRKAMDRTMKRKEKPGKVSTKDLLYLFEAEHDSVIEHAVISFDIKDMSRSLLAQITRHRMSSPTSSSQHYQVYTEYPFVVSEDMKHLDSVEKAASITESIYIDLLHIGIPKEDARQILINAKGVDFLWTVNARSLYNFFRQRMCLRNVGEMLFLAEKLWKRVYFWWPEFAEIVGPQCYKGECKQGRLACGRKFKHPLECL